MVGGWIKMGVGLRTHPKVVRMSSALHADRLRVIGGLFAVWSVFDAHSPDGALEGYTLDAMDEDLSWPGFSAAMQAVGWLEESESGLLAPRYDSHNGPSAKRRAMETERKRVSRSSEDCPADVHDLSASDADKKRSREEKNREEEIPSEAKASDGKPAVDKSKKPKTPAERAKADLWKAAVAVLAQGGCANEAMARSFMGKLVGDYGIEAVKLAVDAAVSSQPADAREYLKATCMRHKGERKDPVTVPSDAPERTLAMLEAQRLTPEQKAASEEARRRVMSALKVVA